MLFKKISRVRGVTTSATALSEPLRQCGQRQANNHKSQQETKLEQDGTGENYDEEATSVIATDTAAALIIIPIATDSATITATTTCHVSTSTSLDAENKKTACTCSSRPRRPPYRIGNGLLGHFLLCIMAAFAAKTLQPSVSAVGFFSPSNIVARQRSSSNWYGVGHILSNVALSAQQSIAATLFDYNATMLTTGGLLRAEASQSPTATTAFNLDPFSTNSALAAASAGLSSSLAKLLLANTNFGKLISELQEGVSSKASCFACLTVTDFYKSPIYSKSAMSAAIRTICISLRLQKPKICHGISHAFEDDLDYIGRHSLLSPEEMCSTLLAVNCAIEPSDKLNWTVYIPPRPPPDHPMYTTHTLDEDSVKQGTIVQVTDMHADLHYEHGTDAVCDEPVCCRKNKDTSLADAMDIGGIESMLAPLEPAGLWGSYLRCDSPLRAVVNALEQISKSHPNAEYWIWTGDIGPHDHFSSRDEVVNHVRIVTQLVKSYVKVPVIPVIGNHEGVPANSFPPPSISGPQSISWLYGLLAEEWSQWLPESALETLRFGGYYTIKQRPRLRTIVLNTNYCARLNPWTLYDSVDPGGQLRWLVSELTDAEFHGDNVHLVGHIAPDPTECTRPWILNYLSIIERFQTIIVGQFFGHSHKDEFRVYYSRDSKPIGAAFIGPSLTSYKGNNPAYRLYHIEPTGVVRDHVTYFFNLTDANLSLLPVWRKLYTFSSYGFPNASPDSLHYLIGLMKMDDELFQRFYRYYSRQADVVYTGTSTSHGLSHVANLYGGVLGGSNTGGTNNVQYCNEHCKANLLDELAVDERARSKKITKKYT